MEMAEEEPDESLTAEAADSCKEISDALEALKLRTLLDGKYDQNNAIVSVHAGSRRHGCSGLGGNAVPYVHQMV